MVYVKIIHIIITKTFFCLKKTTIASPAFKKMQELNENWKYLFLDVWTTANKTNKAYSIKVKKLNLYNKLITKS
jgi:hypothetical protein